MFNLRGAASRFFAPAASGVINPASSRHWAEAGFLFLGLSAAIAAIGLTGGLIALEAPRSVDWRAWLPVAAVAVIVPALGEEFVFRGLLGGRQGALRAALALLAFIAWHPLQLALGLPFAQHVFLRWDFLLIAGLLGLACTISYRRSRSLQPAIAMHWAVVAGWKALGG